MAEELKKKIYDFLKDNLKEEYSILKLKRELENKGIKISYVTMLKWTLVLSMDPESNIIIKDYGNIKIISYIGNENTS